MTIMICQTCSDLIAAVDSILEKRTTGKDGSPEEWFMCPTCGYMVISVNDLNLSAPTLLQKLELQSGSLVYQAKGSFQRSAHQ